MEEDVAGFTVTGSWPDIVEHGERITTALEECGGDGDDHFTEWQEWRPKMHERLSDDINEKTAQQASVDEGKGEREGHGPDEDLLAAGKRVNESLVELREGDPKGGASRWQEAVEHIARAADSAARKTLRRVETGLYKHVMTRVSPYYFDNHLISANISRAGGFGDDSVTYTFQVNVCDDDLKECVRARLHEYEEDVDRWHPETNKDTSSAEAVEGVDLTDHEREMSTREFDSARQSDEMTAAREETGTDEDEDDGAS